MPGIPVLNPPPTRQPRTLRAKNQAQEREDQLQKRQNRARKGYSGREFLHQGPAENYTRHRTSSRTAGKKSETEIGLKKTRLARKTENPDFKRVPGIIPVQNRRVDQKRQNDDKGLVSVGFYP
jgi:hypothetical protein